MTRFDRIVRGLLGAALVAASLLAPGCGPAKAKSCAVCEREECGNMAFAIETTEGEKAETCCPRCGLHWLATTGGEAKELTATEFRTGRKLSAREAVYVEGSDVSPCSEMRSERMDEGCCALLAWDRCLPSLLAFGTRAAADSFRAAHGGELRTFGEVERGESSGGSR